MLTYLVNWTPQKFARELYKRKIKKVILLCGMMIEEMQTGHRNSEFFEVKIPV